ncbi:MAG: hypothetical protein JWM65_2600 [Sphingomonas bacterium]|nr:hypothetical protein [Sphingomonas bacterium]
MTNRARTFAAVTIGLALAMFTQFIALLMTGAGHGWITPFWFSPLLFVLNPIAFTRVVGGRKGAPGIEIVLIVVGVALDVALYSRTMAEGVEYFWRVIPFNWVWLALWSGWQLALIGKVGAILVSGPTSEA